MFQNVQRKIFINVRLKGCPSTIAAGAFGILRRVA